MPKLMNKLSNEWQDAANLVLGLWLMLSPWALDYSVLRTPAANSIMIGAIIAGAAACALYAFQPWEEWTNVALAAWLVVSPWVLGFAHLESVAHNSVVVGTLVGVMALWSTTIEHGTSGQIAGK